MTRFPTNRFSWNFILVIFTKILIFFFCWQRSQNELQHVCAEDHPYACVVCHKELNHQYDIESHQQEHTDQCPYACDMCVCNKTFSKKSNVKKHRQLKHYGQRPHACDVCKKTFNQKSHMKTHQLTHSGQHPYACDVCQKTFSHKCNMRTHQHMHSG